MTRGVNPRDLVLDYHGDLLGLTFTVSLVKPVALAGSEALIEVYDATYFTAFTFEGSDALVFAGEAPPIR